MHGELIIREATVGDIKIIKELADFIWPQAYKHILAPAQIEYMMNLFYSRESLEDQFARHKFLLAYLDSAPVAFASYSTTYESGVFKLQKIYVDTRTRSRGTGKSLINYIVAKIKAAGGHALELNVNRENTARIFYEKLGFRITREENISIGNEYWMNDFVMRFEIES